MGRYNQERDKDFVELGDGITRKDSAMDRDGRRIGCETGWSWWPNNSEEESEQEDTLMYNYA
jgi:hypothetical protein